MEENRQLIITTPQIDRSKLKAWERDLPIYDGPGSVRPGSRGRNIEYEFEGKDKNAFVDWPKEHQRQYAPMLDPKDGHVLTDDEIRLLIESIRHGFNESYFESTQQFVDFLRYRNAVPEKTYGIWEGDISVCRFFTGKTRGEKAENILADIKAINEEQKMGNIKIPGTSIELINYSPCPKCGSIHSFSDVFNYYKNPVPDPKYKTPEEQHALDTRVKCKECGDYFLPAIIVTDGGPKAEHQMICRSQTIREITVTMNASYKMRVLTMKEENIIADPTNPEKAAWRNDVDARLLKRTPGLFTNFLQYTPAPQIINFVTRKNLEINDPLYGTYLPKEAVRYYS